VYLMSMEHSGSQESISGRVDLVFWVSGLPDVRVPVSFTLMKWKAKKSLSRIRALVNLVLACVACGMSRPSEPQKALAPHGPRASTLTVPSRVPSQGKAATWSLVHLHTPP
jgi:hypothetical protein